MIVWAALCVAVAAVPSAAAVHHVAPDGSGDFPTIQAAVDAAAAGDTILLADGTFTGGGNRDIDFGGKDLAVRSASDDASLCIIDCEGSLLEPHRGFHFHSGETAGSSIVAVTVRNGYASGADPHGGGVLVSGASPTFTRCVVLFCGTTSGLGGGIASMDGANPVFDSCIISGCSGGGYGGGVAVFTAGITLVSCTIMGNEADGVGGGLYEQGGWGSVIEDCVIAGNTADDGGGARLGGSDCTLTDCLIWDNAAMGPGEGGGGGGVLLNGGALVGCTVVGNMAYSDGGGVAAEFVSSAQVIRCLIADNLGGAGVACATATDGMVLTCCDVHGNVGGEYGLHMTDQTGIRDNVSEDPLFCDPAFDFSLDAASPCLPENSSCGMLMGARGQGCDSPVERATWGAVKALFRR
jgi:hypothetical protein